MRQSNWLIAKSKKLKIKKNGTWEAPHLMNRRGELHPQPTQAKKKYSKPQATPKNENKNPKKNPGS
jgi:hypothetical protein